MFRLYQAMTILTLFISGCITLEKRNHSINTEKTKSNDSKQPDQFTKNIRTGGEENTAYEFKSLPDPPKLAIQDITYPELNFNIAKFKGSSLKLVTLEDKKSSNLYDYCQIKNCSSDKPDCEPERLFQGHNPLKETGEISLQCCLRNLNLQGDRTVCNQYKRIQTNHQAALESSSGDKLINDNLFEKERSIKTKILNEAIDISYLLSSFISDYQTFTEANKARFRNFEILSQNYVKSGPDAMANFMISLNFTKVKMLVQSQIETRQKGQANDQLNLSPGDYLRRFDSDGPRNEEKQSNAFITNGSTILLLASIELTILTGLFLAEWHYANLVIKNESKLGKKVNRATELQMKFNALMVENFDNKLKLDSILRRASSVSDIESPTPISGRVETDPELLSKKISATQEEISSTTADILTNQQKIAKYRNTIDGYQDIVGRLSFTGAIVGLTGVLIAILETDFSLTTDNDTKIVKSLLQKLHQSESKIESLRSELQAIESRITSNEVTISNF